MVAIRLTISAPLKARALAAHELLCAEYRCPIPYFRSSDPLSELVNALLNHRTRNSAASAAFKRLRKMYPAWEGLRDASAAEVERLIAEGGGGGGVTWPELKTARIQAILHALTGEIRSGRTPMLPEAPLSLDFLEAWRADEAREWLEGLARGPNGGGGIGPKTSAAVVAFSTLRKAALPVDSHHHRVAQRLGLIGPRTAVGPSHAALAALLPAEWEPQEVYDHHEVFMLHGQRCCYTNRPACERCVVLDLCPTGRLRMGLPPPAELSDDRGAEREVPGQLSLFEE